MLEARDGNNNKKYNFKLDKVRDSNCTCMCRLTLAGRWFCNAMGTKVGAFGLNPFIACTGGLLLGEDFSGEGTGLEGF